MDNPKRGCDQLGRSRAQCDHRNLENDADSGILKCLLCGYTMTRSDFNAWLGINSPVTMVGHE